MAGARAQISGEFPAGGGDDLPTMIDRYKPLRKLATGGMAELFLAKQSGLEGFEKVVVIKRILNHLSMDDEFVTMFLDEARIAAKLSHPNIVQIYDLGKSDDTYYIAMEYVSGRNVQHMLTKESERTAHPPVEHVCRIISGVCDGLYYAHSRKDYDGTKLNIVHRDISPQNILVSFAGGVKLVDFGIAKASTQLAQTRAGVLKGKYAYMSPEQVRGAKIDARSDIFSVGLVMYEMLTGHRAFERESSLKTLKAIVQEKPLNPKELNPEIPDAVIKLLSKALEKNPDRRYHTAQDMQLAVEDYLDSAPRKSNNVRLSRYMYDLFDDELNAEGGTMVVDGIGEVIVPTGQKGELKPRVEEDIDHKTLSAALIEPADDSPSAPPTDAMRGKRRKNEPSARIVREETAAGADDLSEEDVEEEVEDKTIPVYDLDEAERNRLMGPSDDATSAGGGAHPSMSDSVGGLDSAATDEIDPSLIKDARAMAERQDHDLPSFTDDEETATVGPEQAQSILAAVNAKTAMPDSSMTNDQLPDPGGPPSTEGPGWEAGTVELSSQGAAGAVGEGGLHSSEAVIGSAGVISADPAGGVRPAASMPGSSGIRPAAASPAVRPPAAAGPPPAGRAIQDVSPPRPASPQRPATEEVARVDEVAPIQPKPAGKMIAGFPAWMVLAAVGAGGFFLIVILAMAVTIAVVLSDQAPATAPWVDVSLKVSPEDATVSLDGEPEPARVLQLQAGKHTIKIEAEGYETFEGELDVPDAPDVFKYSKSLDGGATGDDNGGDGPKKKKKKRGKKKRKK